MLISRKSSNYDVDNLVQNLAFMGRMARKHAPVYEGTKGRMREPILSARDGATVIGHMLDGKGIYIDTDLKALGVDKRGRDFLRRSHVFERSPVHRLIDRLGGDECGAITTYDGMINARLADNKSDYEVNKASITTVANSWSSLYRAGGNPPAGTYASTPGAVKDRTDAGAFSIGLATPGSGTDYLITCGLMAVQQLNMVKIVDLLVCVGSITAASLAAQTVSSAALTRYTDGVGVKAIFEVTTQLGGTAANHTMSYTNQAGTAGQTSVSNAMTTSAIVQRLVTIATGSEIQLASGDYGVRAVSTSTLSASMTAGVYALNLYKTLMWIPGLVANSFGIKPTAAGLEQLVQLPVASSQIGCLSAYSLTNTTSTGIVTMMLQTIYG